MKRKLAMAFVALICSVSWAQAQKSWTFGPKIGLNLSSFTAVNGVNPDWKAGMNIGGFATYRMSDMIAFQGEALFSMMGAEKGNQSVQLNYISIPVLAKFYVWNNLNLHVGPQFSFKVYESFTEGNVTVKNEGAYNAFDLSLMLGAGYEWDFGLTLDLRYGFGLTHAPSDVNSNNQLLQLSAGWKF